MEDFERLGVFYLGRVQQPGSDRPQDELLLYDSKDLVTHAVCVGMTGSGKTGLCIALIEEAALDGIPALVIDPKGDLANLLLTFPELRPEDFRPWINEDDAAKKGLSPDEFAAQQAELWTKGLADWGQGPDRVQRLKASADFAIYTPGSSAGLGVSIVRSFAAPPAALLQDPELLRDKISTTATSLLALLGVDADPLKSREHILLSNIMAAAWNAGADLDLPGLIQQIQSPPFSQVGVLDLESFYPSSDRFQLAMLLNNLLAAPGFEAWTEGEALDIPRMLYTPEGKPRVSIFSIAHLADSERMFFVSLLLNEVLGWIRTQPGTSSLRALLYMDEIFGFFPPVANPPSKTPLLTLLKQARAFGLGVVLATQNPVDLDYKGLANAGTWFIGRLQTERDKGRVLEGLEGAAAGAGAFDRREMDETLAGLGNRVFLMYNAHEDHPEVFQTRWTMSYLRGPLTRAQIKTLMDARRQSGPGQPPAAAAEPVGAGAGEMPSPASVAGLAPEPGSPAPAPSGPPVLPPDIPQYFVPFRDRLADNQRLVYSPALLGAAEVRFADTKRRIDAIREVRVLGAFPEAGQNPDWDAAVPLPTDLAELEQTADQGAEFLPLPPPASQAKSYAGWKKDLSAWIYRSQSLDLLESARLKQVSNLEETEGEFRVRLQQAAREARDAQQEALRKKYVPKIAALEEKVRRAQQVVQREQEQAKGQKLQTAISFGATLLGAFVGRKGLGGSTLGRATTAARGVSRTLDQTGDVDRANETLQTYQQDLDALEAEFEAELQELAGGDAPLEPLTTVTIRPKKSDIHVSLVALVWSPEVR